MIPSQLLKGTLEGCILAVIRKKPTYGYEIAQQLAAYGFGRIAEGTIYPCCCGWRKTGPSGPSSGRRSWAPSGNTTP